MMRFVRWTRSERDGCKALGIVRERQQVLTIVTIIVDVFCEGAVCRDCLLDWWMARE
jgi:hypothetical protein